MRPSFSLHRIGPRQPAHPIVPPLMGRNSYLSALGNAVVFVLVALAGEWTVHQLQYLIEYGQQFNSVMEMTPHRVYMAPLGTLFALLGVGVLGTVGALLHTDSVKRRHLQHRLPPWMHWLLPAQRLQFSLLAFAGTAVALAAVQAGVYFLQENWEWYVVTGHAPGLAVLFAPQHISVLPLHLLIACVASLLLWTLAAWRGAVSLGEIIGELLLRLALRWHLPALPAAPIRLHVSERQLAATHRSLRSPPLIA